MKTKTYDFKAFMKSEHIPEVKPPTMSLIPLAAAPFVPSAIYAEDIQTKMIDAFDPIISLVQGLAYPVAMLVVLGGGLFVMIGNTDKGYSLISRAGMGYVLVMMLPMLLDVLVDAMKAVV